MSSQRITLVSSRSRVHRRRGSRTRPVPLDGFVHVRRLACHDDIGAASVDSLAFAQEVNPGLHGAVTLGPWALRRMPAVPLPRHRGLAGQ